MQKKKKKKTSNKMESKLHNNAQTWHGKMGTNLSNFVSIQSGVDTRSAVFVIVPESAMHCMQEA